MNWDTMIGIVLFENLEDRTGRHKISHYDLIPSEKKLIFSRCLLGTSRCVIFTYMFTYYPVWILVHLLQRLSNLPKVTQWVFEAKSRQFYFLAYFFPYCPAAFSREKLFWFASEMLWGTLDHWWYFCFTLKTLQSGLA